ncbi:MAG: transposase, partial [Candidatus Acidiferrales bacterium]
CIVHMVRASLNYVSWKQRKQVAADLGGIYQAATAVDAGLQLDAFAQKWDAMCPMVSQTWRRHWDRIAPFFAYGRPVYARPNQRGRASCCAMRRTSSDNVSPRYPSLHAWTRLKSAVCRPTLTNA